MILYCLGNSVRKMLHICNAGRMLFRHIFNLWLLIESMNTQTQIVNYRINSSFSSLHISASSVPHVDHWPPASLLRFYPWKMTTVVLYEGALPGGHCFWESLHGQTTAWTFRSQAKRDPQKESRSSSSLDTPAFLWHWVSTHLLCIVSPQYGSKERWSSHRFQEARLSLLILHIHLGPLSSLRGADRCAFY